MQPDFWHQRWQANQIGFHLAETNPLLVKHLPALHLKPNSRLFLPLCGKSLDIHWLLAQEYQVVGVELSIIAVEALFNELKLTPIITRADRLTQYSATNITLFNGDIFELEPAFLGEIDAVYDRAALVALPLAMRSAYSAQVATITQRAPQLLVCFDYDQSRIDGPPFCVNADEVYRCYQQDYVIHLLESTALANGLKGAVKALEQVWLLNHKD